MPAQVVGATSKTAFYVEGDTAPALRRQLLDGNQDPINLDDAESVVINIAWSNPKGSYYRSPRNWIVLDGPCIVEDQNDSEGWVRWNPAEGDLTPPGSFAYQFAITWNNGTYQTVSSVTYEPMVIRSRVGGRAFNKPPIMSPSSQ